MTLYHVLNANGDQTKIITPSNEYAKKCAMAERGAVLAVEYKATGRQEKVAEMKNGIWEEGFIWDVYRD